VSPGITRRGRWPSRDQWHVTPAVDELGLIESHHSSSGATYEVVPRYALLLTREPRPLTPRGGRCFNRRHGSGRIGRIGEIRRP